MEAFKFEHVRKLKLAFEDLQMDISIATAPKETFRFIHVSSLLDHETLSIKYTTSIPTDQYACLSYVWAGLESSTKDPYVLAAGLNINDGLSVPMLITVCQAARKLDCDYLWIDKFAIRQDQGEISDDKRWQLQHMYDVYKSCKVCIVAPGGMARLPKIDERTSWIDRAWTLQEALAPPDVRVLFHWEKRLEDIWNSSMTRLPIEKVTETVAMSPLKSLLEANFGVGTNPYTADEPGDDPSSISSVRVGLFQSENEPPYAVQGLLGAMDEDGEGLLSALWWCLIMRQAKYPEDMILSSMGIMGAVVNADEVRQGNNWSDDDVTKLLILFIKTLMEKEKRAEWFSLASFLGGAKGHSGLPALPLRANLGSGFVRVPKGSYSIVKPRLEPGGEGNWWWLQNTPKVSVLANGDITFTAKAVPIKSERSYAPQEDSTLSEVTTKRIVDEQTYRSWVEDPTSTRPPSAFAVAVGSKTQFSNGHLPCMAWMDPVFLLLVQIIDYGRQDKKEVPRYQVIGYAWGGEAVDAEWKEETLTIGG